MFVITYSGKPLIATQTLNDARELMMDLELEFQTELFNYQMLSKYARPKVIIGRMKCEKEWYFAIKHIEVI